MWFFATRNQQEARRDGPASKQESGPVDMTTLDITYITHRFLGESDRRPKKNSTF